MTQSVPSHPAVVLIGPMGAGKSSVGRRVAKALGVPFTDTDAVVVRAHGPIDALFASEGEAHFRAVERTAVENALTVAAESGGVVALGGGAVLNPETQQQLAGSRVALLTVRPERVASRIRGAKRPLLASEDPLARWAEVYAQRRPLYERLATATFDTSTGPLQGVVDAVVAWARESEEDR